MTPLEFRREMAAYEERRRELDERVIATAWLTVAIENDLRAGRMKSLQQTIDHYAPRRQPEATKKPKPSDIAGQLKWLGMQPKPMSEETRAAMWKPKVPVSANG